MLFIKCKKTILLIILTVSFSIYSCNKDKKEAELALMFSYIDENNIIVDTLPSGLLFSETGFSTPETLESDYPKQGDTVVTVYKAFVLTTGNITTLFDETTTSEPGYYVYKEDPVIEGWEEAIGLMKKDISATVVIPSKLAYGKDQVGIIPPYSPLVFEVRVKNIISSSK
ncbi:MAG: FKBP-type peptidyl-prolyl cis-trans isomerase [Bacteroidales bacterium]|nr:FKBP-type peptidyl-prolyl cis-trans isomerase [Bacteroidales bacterium]